MYKKQPKKYRSVTTSNNTLINDDTSVCPCGLLPHQHTTFFIGMITDRSISIDPKATERTGKPFNHLTVCSHPDIQLRCHNRETGYPAVENTLSHGAPSWRWQILAGPFIDYRACKLIESCGGENRTPIRRLIRMILLIIEYNKTQLKENEQPIKVYLVGDISAQNVLDYSNGTTSTGSVTST